MSLLVVGSVAFDDLETPSGRRERILGGSASYFSLGASHFHPVQVVAVVGEDFGGPQERVFEGRPIDLSGLARKKGRTFHWKGAYGSDLSQARTIETHLNVFQDFHPDLPESFRRAPYVFLGNIDPVLQADVLRQMVRRPDWVALDTMDYWICGAREALEQVLGQVDILLVNEGEARALTGERNPMKIYPRIRAMGPRILVIKRGEYGAMLFSPEGVFVAPAFPLEDVLDPTGAGDTFAGGFLGYLASQGSLDGAVLKRGVLAGTIMASFTVEKFGTECLETIAEHDIKRRMKAFSGMVQVDGL